MRETQADAEGKTLRKPTRSGRLDQVFRDLARQSGMRIRGRRGAREEGKGSLPYKDRKLEAQFDRGKAQGRGKLLPREQNLEISPHRPTCLGSNQDNLLIREPMGCRGILQERKATNLKESGCFSQFLFLSSMHYRMNREAFRALLPLILLSKHACFGVKRLIDSA